MFGYIITLLAALFWTFRVSVTLLYSAEISFPIGPFNMVFEIVVLFVTFIGIALMAKRKMTGAVIYLIAQVSYFGADMYKNIMAVAENQTANVDYLSLLVSIIAIILPVLGIMNIGLSNGKGRKNKKTDWFYGTKEYDRKFDERADKNQYKF